jgi:hypothetical protein
MPYVREKFACTNFFNSHINNLLNEKEKLTYQSQKNEHLMRQGKIFVIENIVP